MEQRSGNRSRSYNRTSRKKLRLATPLVEPVEARE
jgi:hypothetical protein